MLGALGRVGLTSVAYRAARIPLRHDACVRESGTWPGAIRICRTNDFYAAISAQHTIALHTVLQRP